MKYQEVTIHANVESLDSLILFLQERGITGLVISDPREWTELMEGKEPYHWDYIDESVIQTLMTDPSITFYTDPKTDLSSLLKELSRFNVSIRIVDDQEWLHRWKDYFEPVLITDRFVVKPAWSSYTPKPGEQVIDMDPGMAFGTGTHATTRLCLRLLQKYMKKGDRVLDVGTGTGILAIAAAMLGGEEVLAADLDPQALATARENIRKNNVDHVVHTVLADLTEGIDSRSDVIVANLMADLVIRLTGSIKEQLTERGLYISGGILLEKEASVRSALEASGFHVLEMFREEEWCAIAAQRM
ncbi:MAG TPA: 50S ribosomal protein L11 methyltransferase [Anaerovoracaceae bacterium]|nr:50S ribosomal protein L11 methyltransferase [Anaerovoracaceae bacterium]